jgi:hypothetical protein
VKDDKLRKSPRRESEPRSGPRKNSERTETDPDLNNPDATPGTGMLPPIGRKEGNEAPSG